MAPTNNSDAPVNNPSFDQQQQPENDVLRKAASAAVANLDDHRPTKRIKNDTVHVVSSSSTPREGSSPTPAAAAAEDCKNSTTDDADTSTAHIVSLQQCLHLLLAPLSPSLNNTSHNLINTDEQILSFRALWKTHGFRTSIVSSPRPAVSIYLDSCISRHDDGATNNDTTKSVDTEEGRNYLLMCIGMHHTQLPLESAYLTIIKSIYCLVLFIKRMRSVRKNDMDNIDVMEIVSPWEKSVEKEVLLSNNMNEAKKEGESKDIKSTMQELSDSSTHIISQLLSKLTEIDHSLRADQLLHEYNRISYENCTLANACLQRWLNINGDNSKQLYDLDEVYYKASPPGRYIPKYERITINMKDLDEIEPNHNKLIFLPSLTKILTSRAISAATTTDNSSSTVMTSHPVDSVVDDMIAATWKHLLSCRYYVDETRKGYLGPELKKFYLSGLLGGKERNMPILL